ncbi:MFS transporter [Pseudomonas putida]|uniref:MFS transporter n=1 Tax=Pseudomonas TaxID=286 RepID=UPI00119850EA|nr:MFS transporter [Pseudomonas putida]EKT4559446.1 MFS transporter [Pseudomonas putida]MDP9538026.1 MFS transporter [Pseudomonas putida]QDY37119.1 multidrug transporter CflA [Pseudomonas putida]
MSQAKNFKITILRPLLLTLLCLLGVFPLDVILPSLPALSEAFQVEPKQIAYSVSLFAFGVAVAQIFIGPLSDRTGRKRLLIVGLGVSTAGAIGCLISTDYEIFLAFRLLQAAGCGSLVGQALVQDLYSGKQRNTMRILLTSASGLFISISPVAGAAIQQSIGWTGSFTVFIGIAISVIVLAWVLLNETPVLCAGNSGVQSYIVMLRDAFYVTYSLQATLAFACHFSFIVVAPLVLMEQLGLTPYQFSVVFIAYGLAYVVGGAIATFLNNRISAQAQICAGFLLIGSAGAALLIWQWVAGLTVIGLMIPMILCTAGTTLVRPTAATQALARYPQQAGAAASLNTTVLFAGGGFAGTVIASAEQLLPLSLGILFLSSALGGFLLLTRLKGNSLQHC